MSDNVPCSYRRIYTGLEPLLGHLPVLDDRSVPLHPSGERDHAHDGLWFTGYRPVFQGYFHAACSSARQIADAILAQRDRQQ